MLKTNSGRRGRREEKKGERKEKREGVGREGGREGEKDYGEKNKSKIPPYLE